MLKNYKISLSARLVLFSSLIVLIAVVVMGLLFTFFLNRRFRDYLVEENQTVREELVRQFTSYMRMSGNMDPQWLEQFSNVYMEQGMFISVNTPDGDLMWSCMDDNNSMCMEHMRDSQLSPVQLEELDKESFEIPIGSSGESTVLSISYMPEDSFSENDRFFLSETYTMLLLSIIITLSISVLMSLLLSRSLSKPLAGLTAYATRLAGHDYSAIDRENSSIVEIDQLHNAVENLAASLQSQEKLRKRLTSDVSHELRTPLASLQSSMEAMIDGIWPADNQRLEICRNEILRLSSLVRDLDDLHKYDQPLKELNRQDFSLKKSLKAAVSLFEKDMTEKDLSLSVECPDIMIHGDKGRLKQVWINLLSNALKYTPRSGKIAIEVVAKENIEMAFFNTGEAIDSKDLPHIFERFYKAEESRNSSGSGLGLSIVKEIIELHGGNVAASSREGEGTTITIKI